MKDNDRLENIKQILMDWNPIDVPDYIKVNEYNTYAFEILTKYKTENDIQKYLKLVFRKNMGFDLTKEAKMDIKDISKKIAKIS